MISAAVLALLATLHGWPGSIGPVVAPLDQASDSIVVRNVHAGSHVDVYANAVWIGAGVASRPLLIVKPVRALLPGDAVVAVEHYGSFVAYGVRPTTVSSDYPTYHYDTLRTGWNQSETALTQSTVGSSKFGEVFSTSIDGNVIAQPLVLAGVDIPGLGTHDVLYVATENDSLYAIDAATGHVLWKQHYADASQGYSPLSNTDVNCSFIAPSIGITGTPVVDRTTDTMYFVTDEKRVAGQSTTFHQFLHAVDVTTGLDRSGSPIDIQASAREIGPRLVTFDPHWQMQRPGLLLRNGVVYIGFGSYCDLHRSTVHGWVLGYSANGLGQVAVFNASSGSTEGLASVWQGGYGLASDAGGNVYFATGNGQFDGNTGGHLWGDTVLKLSPSLGVLDYFTPFNQATLNSTDDDLGGGGPMLLPPQSGSIPNLLVEQGKPLTLYLINRDAMGEYTPGGPDRVVQELNGVVGKSHGVWGGPGYYMSASGQPVVFYCGGQDHLKAFALLTSPMTQLMKVDQTTMTFGGEGGAIPSVSSNGMVGGTAVVWAVERPHQPDEKVRLTAFAADRLGRRLVDLVAGPWFNTGGGFFAVPTVINGHAYVGTGNSVVGFGLR